MSMTTKYIILNGMYITCILNVYKLGTINSIHANMCGLLQLTFPDNIDGY